MHAALAILVCLAACTNSGSSERQPSISTVSGEPADNTAVSQGSPTSAAANPIQASSSEPALDSFCTELAAIEEDARASGQRITDAPDTDTFTGLIASIAALGDLRTFIRRLEASAPRDISADLAAIGDSLEPDQLVLSDPVAAIANAVIGGLSVGGSYERVDAYSVETCGRPVFGDVSLVVTFGDRDPLPRKEGDLWFLRSTNFYGENLCEAQSRMGVDSDVVTITCGHRGYGIGLPELAMLWSLEFDGPPVTDFAVNGGRLALLREETVPAEGLNPPTWRARITVLDVSTGDIQLDLPINGDNALLPVSTAEDELVDLHLDGVLDSGLVLLGYNSRFELANGLGSAGVLAFDQSAEGAYTIGNGSIAELAPDFHYAVVDATEGERFVVNLQTGDRLATILDEMGTHQSRLDRCSTGFTLGVIDRQRWFYDPATDEFFSIPNRLVDANSIDHYMTEHGILITSGGEVALADRSGSIVWELLDDVLARVWWVDGHLVVRNRAGDLIQVDIRDGSDAGPWTYRDDPPFAPADEGWDGWTSSRGDTIFTPWMPGPCGAYNA